MTAAASLDCAGIAERVVGGLSAGVEVEAALQRAEADELNAVVRVYRDSALAAAAEVDRRVAAGERLPLAGVPMLLKDNICYRGHEVSACSKILAGFKPPYDATATARLRAAGAVIIGAANMDEFAMGSSNETSARGPVKNPVDPTRIPGGSSGGSCAAVASGMVTLALGSDTGGSIRQPAALCGCVGFKPTYGVVSRYGLLAFGSSLDQIGPLARSVADAALCSSIIGGHDPADSTSSTRPALSGALPADPLASLRGLRVGHIPQHLEGCAPGTAARLEAAKAALREAGAELVDVSMPHERYVVAIYYIVATGEASSNLARYDGVHYGFRDAEARSLFDVYALSRAHGFGREVKRRIMLGTYVLSAGYYDAYYRQAMRVRRLLCRDYDEAFARCDVLLGPTSPTTAFKVGEKMSDPLQMYLCDVFTIGANLAGLPAISIPGGRDEQGLPVGLHLQAPQFADERLLAVAAGLEAALA